MLGQSDQRSPCTEYKTNAGNTHCGTYTEWRKIWYVKEYGLRIERYLEALLRHVICPHFKLNLKEDPRIL
jgi:hypothetical protein